MNLINHEQQTVSHSEKGKELQQKVRRLRNITSDIGRSEDLSTEPQRHIDRLYAQACECIELFESQDIQQSELYKQLHEDTNYAWHLRRALAEVSVGLKNAMTSPIDFYIVVLKKLYGHYDSYTTGGIFPKKEEEVFLELIQANRNRNNQHLKESKKFIDDVLCCVSKGVEILEAIRIVEKGMLGVSSAWIDEFDEAVSKSGTTDKEYISKAIHQRLEREGFLESSED